jgi:hypothetical protein
MNERKIKLFVSYLILLDLTLFLYFHLKKENARVLAGSASSGAFLDDAASRLSIRDVNSFRDILNGPGPRSPSTYKNKNKWKRMKHK